MFLDYFPIVSPVLFIVVVTILGFITPGYSHINHTISRLAIEQYGWIEGINMVQLALGIELSGRRLTRSITDGGSVKVIRYIFSICAVFLLIAAFFPTDPIENVPLDVTILTPTGLVHIGVVIAFLCLSPFGIVKLTAVLRKQKRYRPLATFTMVAGISALLGSAVWFFFYFMGLFLEYRGIFQKAIAFPVFAWLILINYASQKKIRS